MIRSIKDFIAGHETHEWIEIMSHQEIIQVENTIHDQPLFNFISGGENKSERYFKNTSKIFQERRQVARP